MNVPCLRSPHDKTRGIVYFGRMLDKIRLHTAGKLPGDYLGNLGIGFDERCVKFLWVEYPALVARVKQGGTDDDILEWCFGQGRKPSDEEIEVWNEFMRKRGWNDDGSARLQQRLVEGGFEKRTDIQTFFDFIDLDEGRDPAAGRG
jgi:gluconokinase